MNTELLDRLTHQVEREALQKEIDAIKKEMREAAFIRTGLVDRVGSYASMMKRQARPGLDDIIAVGAALCIKIRDGKKPDDAMRDLYDIYKKIKGFSATDAADTEKAFLFAHRMISEKAMTELESLQIYNADKQLMNCGKFYNFEIVKHAEKAKVAL